MSEPAAAKPKFQDVLDPIDRFSEVVYGVIVTMTITGSVSVSTAGEQDIRHLLYTALSCNLTWGIADAVMYVIASLVDRGRAVRVAREVGAAADAAEGRRIVAEALPDGVAQLLPTDVLEGVRAAIDSSAPPPHPRLTRDDLLGALAIFHMLLLATLPISLPFLFLSDVALALRVSNAVALGLLFVSGSAIGHYAGFGTWRSGFAMLVIGAVLVAIIIALGG